jgi:hypothetical protein
MSGHQTLQLTFSLKYLQASITWLENFLLNVDKEALFCFQFIQLLEHMGHIYEEVTSNQNPKNLLL